jgi:hypothetical protein
VCQNQRGLRELIRRRAVIKESSRLCRPCLSKQLLNTDDKLCKALSIQLTHGRVVGYVEACRCIVVIWFCLSLDITLGYQHIGSLGYQHIGSRHVRVCQGFYRVVKEVPQTLLVGPYQGTHGCLRIPFSKGVCGAAAADRKTLVVDDVQKFPGHIACSSTYASMPL